MTQDEIRMHAYHYGFSPTGVPEIDLILSAVACAGKSYHYTMYWTEENNVYPYHTGNSPVEWIQNAANAAAKAMQAARNEQQG